MRERKKKIKKQCFWQGFSSNRLNIKQITLANQRKPQRHAHVLGLQYQYKTHLKDVNRGNPGFGLLN